MRGSAETASQPTRVLFVITSTGIGGTETVLGELIPRLDAELITPTVCSMRAPGVVADRLRLHGVPIHSLHASPSPHAMETVKSVFQLAALVSRLKIHVVHTMLYRANVVGSLASRLAGNRPVIVTSQRSLDPITGHGAVAAVRVTRPLSARIVAVSEAVRDHLVATEGVAAERVVVIANGVDSRRFCPPPEGVAGSRKRREAGELLVGAAGRLTKVKGLDSLIRAIGILQSESLPIRARIAGDGPERRALQQLAQELGVDHRIEFMGEVRAMEDFYRSIDVFALSSLREGSPNVVLEAMASGCPVVATQVGGVPEIVEDGRTGFLIQPDQPSALAEVLSRMASSPELSETLARAARLRVEENFMVETTARDHQDLFRGLAGRRQGA